MGMIINPYAFGASYDADAQAFFTAAGITDTTQKDAVNQLVLDLKSYSLWSKMLALYPMVGGTSTTHSYNLVNTSNYQITWNGGWTHSSNGALPNGTNAYANTGLVPSSAMTLNSAHISYYSRTTGASGYAFGTSDSGLANRTLLLLGGTQYASLFTAAGDYFYYSPGVTKSLLTVNRTASNVSNVWEASTKKATSANASTSRTTKDIYLGASNDNGTAGSFSNAQCAFASIGTGLTDSDVANLYTAVQTFQTTLGRQVGVPIVSDADAQAFLNAAVITDTTQANAVNQLVLDLKSYSIWTKMKALYPFVGGTASTHKWNLKDPRDLDAAFRLVFSGGLTHDSNGITGNGTNAYGDTFVNDQNDLSIDDKHISIYQRNILSDPSGSSMGIPNSNRFYLNFGGSNYSTLGMAQSAFTISTPQQGMFTMSKIISGEFKYYQNALTAVTKTGTNVAQNAKHYILACNNAGAGFDYTSANIAFASLGNGLSSTDVTNLRTAVVAFQTTLSRNV